MVTDAGATVDVRVYNYGIPLADADLAGLVKRGIEGQLVREREDKSVRLLSSGALRSMTWHISARTGRPPKTFVRVELFEGNSKISDVYSLTSGPDDPQLKVALISPVHTLTARSLGGH
jgi:hypothetical protein